MGSIAAADHAIPRRPMPSPAIPQRLPRTEYVRYRTETAGEKWHSQRRSPCGRFMKTYLATGCAVFATLPGGSMAVTAQDSHSDVAHAETYVKDSAITTKIKIRLAAEHVTSM